jgi:hypothetical protein
MSSCHVFSCNDKLFFIAKVVLLEISRALSILSKGEAAFSF